MEKDTRRLEREEGYVLVGGRLGDKESGVLETYDSSPNLRVRATSS